MKPNMPSLFDDDFFSEYEKKDTGDEQPEVSPEKNEETTDQPPRAVSSETEPSDDTEAPTEPVSEEKEDSVKNSPAAPEGDVKPSDSSPVLPKDPPATPPKESADTHSKNHPSAAEKIPRSRPALELPGGGEAELDRQIRTELIQSDYAAMIHKDYPFAPDKVEVVTRDDKKKPAKSTEEHSSPSPLATQNERSEPAPQPEAESQPPGEPELPAWKLDKSYYTIGEVARLFAVNISHIRFWTNEFKLKPRTNRKGDRLYAPAQIETLRLIHYLVKIKKFTLKGAKEKLKGGKEAVNHQLVLKESLTGLRDALRALKAQLE